MSLRMNLRGWSESDLRRVLGSRDAAVLGVAIARLDEKLTSREDRKAGAAWLRTLVENGHTLAWDREPVRTPESGELLTLRMETEVHVAATCALLDAVSPPQTLDLTVESSTWTHDAVGGLHREVSASGFTRAKGFRVEYFSWMHKLSHGSPLFGDDFRSEWSFYSTFKHAELGVMIPVFQAAAAYERPVPEGYPEEVTRTLTRRVSDSSRAFLADLILWFGRLHEEGQDAFIVWW